MEVVVAWKADRREGKTITAILTLCAI